MTMMASFKQEMNTLGTSNALSYTANILTSQYFTDVNTSKRHHILHLARNVLFYWS